MKKCKVFFVSDSTGLTVESLGNALLSQFENFDFEIIVRPYVNNYEAIEQIKQEVNASDQPTLVFTTLVDKQLRAELTIPNGYC